MRRRRYGARCRRGRPGSSRVCKGVKGFIQELVLILADGRFHEEALRRAVQAQAPMASR